MVEVAVSEELGRRIGEVREKVKKAGENATEDKKLGNRTNFALDYLYSYRDMAQLIKAVQDLGKFSPYISVVVRLHEFHINVLDFRHFDSTFFSLL